MPTAVREQAAVAAKAALAGLAGVTALREYYDEIGAGQVPAVILFERDGHRVDELATGAELVTMPLMIVGIVKAATAEAAATAANDLHARVVAAITGNAALLGLIEEAREIQMRGPRMEGAADSAEFFAAFEVDINLIFARTENDAYQFG